MGMRAHGEQVAQWIRELEDDNESECELTAGPGIRFQLCGLTSLLVWMSLRVHISAPPPLKQMYVPEGTHMV